MTTLDLFHAGDLNAAIQEQAGHVKAQPSNADHRVTLIALLVMSGELERAETHLRALAQTPELLPGLAVYSSLLQAEEERRRVFDGDAVPSLPPESTDALRRRAAIPGLIAGERHEETAAAVEELDSTPVCGTIDGIRFTSLRDYDDVLGPVLEVFAGGRYLWLPFHRVRSLTLSEPEYLLDLVWAKADLVDADDDRAVVYLPVLYPGSSRSPDGLVRIGRKTDWIDAGPAGFRGVGQRIWLADDREVPLRSVRQLVLDPAD